MPITAVAESQNRLRRGGRRRVSKRPAPSFPWPSRCARPGRPAPSGRLRALMLDRVIERRRAAQLARHCRDQEGWRSRRSLVGWDAHKQPSRTISTIRPATRHARSRRATGESVAAAGAHRVTGRQGRRRRHRGNAATPARSRLRGHGSGFAKQCVCGERATALRRPRTTGRALTQVGAAANAQRLHAGDGPRRPCHPSVRESPGPRRRLQRRLNVRASMPLTNERALALGRLVIGSAEGRRDASAIRQSGRRDARARGRLSAPSVGRSRPSGGLPAVTATRSARLSQPWHWDREEQAARSQCHGCDSRTDRVAVTAGNPGIVGSVQPTAADRRPRARGVAPPERRMAERRGDLRRSRSQTAKRKPRSYVNGVDARTFRRRRRRRRGPPPSSRTDR